MKYYIVLFLMAGIFYACDKDDDYTLVNADPELLGTWNLIEMYLDPGDGSGSFQPVVSDKQINFQVDGIISSNGDLCNLSTTANKVTTGRYSLIDTTFSSPDCNNLDHDYKFEYSDNILIITYQCIEPCQMKYEKEE